MLKAQALRVVFPNLTHLAVARDQESHGHITCLCKTFERQRQSFPQLHTSNPKERKGFSIVPRNAVIGSEARRDTRIQTKSHVSPAHLAKKIRSLLIRGEGDVACLRSASYGRRERQELDARTSQDLLRPRPAEIMSKSRWGLLSASDRPPNKRDAKFTYWRGRTHRAVAHMMHHVEPEAFMELDCFFVRQSLPEEIQGRTLQAAIKRPGNLRTRQIDPEKAQVFVGMLREEPLYVFAVVRIRQHENLMHTGELPR